MNFVTDVIRLISLLQ